eukprot:5896998-Prymnesium_polylepis.1
MAAEFEGKSRYKRMKLHVSSWSASTSLALACFSSFTLRPASVAPPVQKGEDENDDRDERAYQKIVIVIQVDRTAERHDRDQVQREDADDDDEFVVEGRIWDGENDTQRAEDLNQRDEDAEFDLQALALFLGVPEHLCDVAVAALLCDGDRKSCPAGAGGGWVRVLRPRGAPNDTGHLGLNVLGCNFRRLDAGRFCRRAHPAFVFLVCSLEGGVRKGHHAAIAAKVEGGTDGGQKHEEGKDKPRRHVAAALAAAAVCSLDIAIDAELAEGPRAMLGAVAVAEATTRAGFRALGRAPVVGLERQRLEGDARSRPLALGRRIRAVDALGRRGAGVAIILVGLAHTALNAGGADICGRGADGALGAAAAPGLVAVGADGAQRWCGAAKATVGALRTGGALIEARKDGRARVRPLVTGQRCRCALGAVGALHAGPACGRA